MGKDKTKTDTMTIAALKKENMQLRQLLADYANGYYDTETIRKFLNNENKRS